MKPNFLKAMYFMLNVLKKEKLFEEKFFTADDAKSPISIFTLLIHISVYAQIYVSTEGKHDINHCQLKWPICLFFCQEMF